MKGVVLPRKRIGVEVPETPRRMVLHCERCGVGFSVPKSRLGQDPLRFCSRDCLYSTATERFWKQIDFNGPVVREELGPCWMWTGAKTERGYGMLKMGGATRRRMGAHRFSYELHIGPLGPLLACHRCDNPPCVNPAHLFAGTTRDNAQDAARKGRTLKGNRFNAKLTPDEAVEVFRLVNQGVRYPVIAGRFGISMSQVSTIKFGRAWREVTGATYVPKGRADTEDLDAIEEILRRDEILTTETECLK